MTPRLTNQPTTVSFKPSVVDGVEKNTKQTKNVLYEQEQNPSKSCGDNQYQFELF